MNLLYFSKISPPRVDIMVHKNDTLEKENNQIEPSSHITTTDTQKNPTINHPPMCTKVICDTPKNPIILYPPLHKKQAHNTPDLILYPPTHNVLYQPSYNDITCLYDKSYTITTNLEPKILIKEPVQGCDVI